MKKADIDNKFKPQEQVDFTYQNVEQPSSVRCYDTQPPATTQIQTKAEGEEIIYVNEGGGGAGGGMDRSQNRQP